MNLQISVPMTCQFLRQAVYNHFFGCPQQLWKIGITVCVKREEYHFKKKLIFRANSQLMWCTHYNSVVNLLILTPYPRFINEEGEFQEVNRRIEPCCGGLGPGGSAGVLGAVNTVQGLLGAILFGLQSPVGKVSEVPSRCSERSSFLSGPTCFPVTQVGGFLMLPQSHTGMPDCPEKPRAMSLAPVPPWEQGTPRASSGSPQEKSTRIPLLQDFRMTQSS